VSTDPDTPPTFVREQDFAVRQHQGTRENQEDSYSLTETALPGDPAAARLLLIVGDGLGGHAGGSIASYLAVHAFQRSFEERTGTVPERLRAALNTANETLGQVSARMPATIASMGTTLLALVAGRDRVQWISVGDSPLFLFRAGKLTRLNEDHSYAPNLESQVRDGSLTEEEAERHPGRHRLQSALLGGPVALVDLPKEPHSLEAGDILLAASDGILTLPLRAMERILTYGRDSSAGKLADALILAIRQAGHPRQDNTTLALVRIPAN
jgi:serine/threonine protein phosphatase PrpC